MYNTPIDILGWTLLHFAWQAALIGVLFRIAHRLLADRPPQQRYRLCLITLGVIAGLPILTAVLLISAGSIPGSGDNFFAFIATEQQPDWLPVVVVAWITGVGFKAAAALSQWRLIGGMIRAAEPLPFSLAAAVERSLENMGLKDRVATLISNHLASPVTCGWLRPVILIPAGVLTCLDARQLDAIIVHELSHIRRRDFLVNTLQIVIETLFFFHPSVYDISEQTRIERECCCDRDVLDHGVEALTYSKALLALEEYRHAAREIYDARLLHSSQGGHLLDRIQRINHRMFHDPSNVRRSSGLFGRWAALALSGLLLVPVTALMLIQTSAHAPPAAIETHRAPALVSPQPPGTMAVAAPRLAASAKSIQDTAGQAKTGTGPERHAVAPRSLASVFSPIGVARAASTETEFETADQKVADHKFTDSAVLATTVPVVSMRAPESSQSGDTDAIVIAANTTADDLELAKMFSGPDSLRGGELRQWSTPRYPSQARLRGMGEIVTVEFLVDENGLVQNIVASSEHSRRIFSRSVAKALQDWQFQPLIIKGQAQAHTRREVFHFSLNQDWAPDGMCRIGENVLWRCSALQEYASENTST